MGGAQVGGLAHGNDLLLADQNRAVLEEAEFAELAAALGAAPRSAPGGGKCEQLSGRVD